MSDGRCIHYPLDAAQPYVGCEMSGQNYQCAGDQLRFLSAEYGPGVREPNVAVLK